MEPFRETLSAFLESKRMELKTIVKTKKNDNDTDATTEDAEKPALDYFTSKTLRTIKDFAVERQRKKKTGSKDVKDIAL